MGMLVKNLVELGAGGLGHGMPWVIVFMAHGAGE